MDADARSARKERAQEGRMMGLRYLFPAWAARHIASPPTPAAVKKYFDARGFRQSREQWRKMLRNKPDYIVISFWACVCEATGEPLSTFLNYTPTGVMPVIRRVPPRRPRKQQPQPNRRAAAPLAAPNPADFFGGDDA